MTFCQGSRNVPSWIEALSDAYVIGVDSIARATMAKPTRACFLRATGSYCGRGHS